MRVSTGGKKKKCLPYLKNTDTSKVFETIGANLVNVDSWYFSEMSGQGVTLCQTKME